MTDYITDEAHGANWTLLLGDSCERLAEIDTDTVDLSICSPPFASLFTYSPSVRDLGNASTRGEFLEHYGFIIREQLRVTKPGRVACIHVQQLTTSKTTHGYMGMTDFRGEVIRAFQDGGWQFNGEVTVWKDPQAQSIRTRSHALAFATKNRDSAGTRPASRNAAPASIASSAASAKLKVCRPITTGQPQAAASIRFWPPSGAKLPPSKATSARP